MPRIVINPGHCPGIDPGACGEYSTEADIVRKVGEVLQKDLEAIDYEVFVIQDDSLQAICDFSNSHEPDVFISIHCNAAANPEAVGTETLHYVPSEEGEKLAECVQNQFIATFDTVDRGTKDGSRLYVIRNTNGPSILVELGFISNPDEENFLNENIEEMAHALARGITDYL